MGMTDTSIQAENWVCTRQNYIKFIDSILEMNATPIFEWCAPQNQIVIYYPEPKLVLTAIRDTITGRHWSMDEIHKHVNSSAEFQGVEIVRSWLSTGSQLINLIEEIRNLENDEGRIIRFDTGAMLKIKSDEYCKIHRAKDGLRFEKNVIETILDEQMDDIKAALPSADRERIQKYENDFWHGVQRSINYHQELYDHRVVDEFGNDRRRIAQELMPSLGNPMSAGILFGRMDNKGSFRELIINLIKKNLGSQTRVDAVRWLFEPANWKEPIDDSE